jgi:hypothetical protein
MRVEPARMRVESSRMRVESSRMRVELTRSLPRRVLIRHACGPQACTGNLGLCIYCNKVI